MRFILFLLTFIFWGCSDQQDTSKLSIKDTAVNQPQSKTELVVIDSLVRISKQQKQLLEGKPVNDITGLAPVTATDYLYSIDLTGTDYLIRINKQSTTLPYERASAFIKANEQKIKGNTVSIITSNKTPYRKVVDALDLMVINNIKKYKLVTKGTIR